MIVSASRRCDIPACFAEWMENRVREGFVLVANPRNPRQVRRVELTPKSVDAFVFWTKNPAPMLDRLDAFRDFMYEFQFTLTPYGHEIEPGLPSKEKVIIPSFLQLADRIGPRRVIWRYDPIFLSEKYTEGFHEETFGHLARSLKDATDRVTISFIDTDYRGVKGNLDVLGLLTIDDMTRLRLAGKLARIAAEYDLIIDACAESSDLASVGVEPAHCISAERFEHLTGRPVRAARAKGQRPACGCSESTDIGAYNMCGNGCRYCYANYSPTRIAVNMRAHNPASPTILSTAEEIYAEAEPAQTGDNMPDEIELPLPPGTKTHSMKLAFHGGEIYFLHLDAFGNREDLVLARIAADAPTMLRPSYPAFVGVNVDETVLTLRMMEAIANVLADKRKVFRKAAIVGCGRKHLREFEKALLYAGVTYPVAFFEDFEKAKEWLI